jgi:hypothetical protein
MKSGVSIRFIADEGWLYKTYYFEVEGDAAYVRAFEKRLITAIKEHNK